MKNERMSEVRLLISKKVDGEWVSFKHNVFYSDPDELRTTLSKQLDEMGRTDPEQQPTTSPSSIWIIFGMDNINFSKSFVGRRELFVSDEVKIMVTGITLGKKEPSLIKRMFEFLIGA